MFLSRLKTSIISFAALAGGAAPALANTQTAWSNPLLRAVPVGAKGFISIDLAGTGKALTSALRLVEGATGSGLNQVAAEALGMLHVPKPVRDAFAKDSDRRAIAYYDPPAEGGAMLDSVVFVLGLRPGNTMAAALKSATQHEVDGIPYVDFNDIEAHVEGDVLLLTRNPRNLTSALKSLRGGLHIGAAELNRLSGSIEPTAEVIGWMDSQTAMNAKLGAHSATGLATGTSFGLSLGLHATGLSLSFGPLELSVGGKVVNLSQFRPLPEQYPRTLPGGAYLLTCLANPWPLLDKFHVTPKAPSSVKGMIDGLKAAIRGNYVLGLYPTRLKNGAPEGIDLLLELRPNEGNDPAGVLAKLMARVKRAFLPGDVNVFESFSVAGADHAYRLNKVVASLLRAGLKMSLRGGPDALLREKNLVFAGVGANILVATSEPVLRKAVAALKYGRSALAYDPKFGELAKDGARPTQFVIAASLSRTLSLVTTTLASMSGRASAKSVAGGVPLDMIGGFLKAWPDPVMLRLSIAPAGLSGRLFLPVNFETLALFFQGGKNPSR